MQGKWSPNTTNWTFPNGPASQNCCSFTGVSCDSSSMRVVSLSLPGMLLTGPLPLSISLLSFVVSLDLSQNSLNGSIADIAWSSLPVLSSLDLSGNKFNGYLFAYFPPSLQYLDLSANQLEGCIPAPWQGNTVLSVLLLHSNKLSCEFPALLVSFANLTVLDLGQNNFTGSIPGSLAQLQKLERISLVQNVHLSNQFPAMFVTSMPGLRQIQLGWYPNAPATMFPPSSSWNCPSLEILDVLQLGLVGSISEGICKCPNLQNLILTANHLVGPIPECLGGLTKLQRLLFANNNLTLPIPCAVAQMQSLVSFALAYNDFSGEVPPCFFNNPNITVIDLSANQFFGNLPDTIGNATSLVSLDLSYNQFSGPIPASIGNLRNLAEVHFPFNNFSSSIPSSWVNLKSLEVVDISHNQLVSGFTVNPFDAEFLRYLDISYNGFSGDLSGCFFYLPSITFLLASNNNFSSGLTSCGLPIPQKSILSVVDISENGFSGELPLVFCDLPALQELRIANNDFDHLPSCIAASSSLKLISAAGNNLRDLPYDSLSSLFLLTNIDISSNFLGAGGRPFPLRLFQPPFRLSTINIANNSFVGPFPLNPCYGLSDTISSVDLSYNNIIGIDVTDPRNTGRYCGTTFPSLSTLSMVGCGIPQVYGSPYTVQSSGSVIGSSRFLVSSMQYLVEFFSGLRQLQIDDNEDLEGALAEVTELSEMSFFSATGTRFRRGLYDAEFLYLDLTRTTFYDNFVCFDALGHSGILSAQLDPFYFNYTNCYCKEGFFGKAPFCLSCLTIFGKNFVCPGPMFSSTTRNDIKSDSGFVFAQGGYWASPPVSVEEMRAGTAYPSHMEPCAYYSTSLSPCRPSADDLFQVCKEGYEDRLCSRCSRGYYPVGSVCAQCPSKAVTGVVLVAYVLTIFLLTFLGFVNRPSSSGPIKVLVFFLQMCSFIIVPFPNSSATASRFFSVSQYWISFAHVHPVTSPHCFGSELWSFEFSYWMRLSIPILLPVYVGCIVGLFWLAKKANILVQAASVVLARWSQALIFLMYLLYMTVSEAVMLPLLCSNDPGLHRDFMVNVPYHECSPTLQAVSSVAFVLYVVGLPVSAFYLMRRQGCRSIVEFLMSSYTKNMKYWEFVIVVRRILVLVLFSLVFSTSIWQAFLVGLTLASSLFFQVYFQPYNVAVDNYAEAASLVLLLVFFSLYLRVDAPFVGDTTGMVVASFLLQVSFIAFMMGLIFLRTRLYRILSQRLSSKNKPADVRMRTETVQEMNESLIAVMHPNQSL
eukprot:ANDGO_02991.mRNA.1 MDIS1-interacting receptor like kinase 1